MEGNLQKLLCIRAIITINYTVILNIPWMEDVDTHCLAQRKKEVCHSSVKENSMYLTAQKTAVV